MSLQSRLTSVLQAIGTDMKAKASLVNGKVPNSQLQVPTIIRTAAQGPPTNEEAIALGYPDPCQIIVKSE